MDPSVKSLQDLRWHLANFHSLVAQRLNQLRHGLPWSLDLHQRATVEMLDKLQERFNPLLNALGGTVVIPVQPTQLVRDELGGPLGYPRHDAQPLFRWFAPQRTVDLLGSIRVEDDSAEQTELASCLYLLAEHQMRSLRMLELGQENQGVEDFLKEVEALGFLYRRFSVFGWATYFSQISIAHRDGYLEEFVVLSPFGTRAWVYPKPDSWVTLTPDQLLGHLLQTAQAVEAALSVPLLTGCRPPIVWSLLYQVTSSVVLSGPPACLAHAMKSFNQSTRDGRIRGQLITDAYNRIERVHRIVVGNVSASKR